MSIFFIAIAVIGATVIWPVNRWVMYNHGRPQVYGFWASLTGAIVSLSIALAKNQSILQPKVWAVGAVIGFAFAIGYCVIILHCMQIGPFGPTVAMNNMGIVWPVVLGALWLKPHPINELFIIALIMVGLSLFFFGLSHSGSSNIRQTRGVSARWIWLAFLGWIFSGISMTGQLVASIYTPDSYFAILFAFEFTATLILATLVLRPGRAWFNRKELMGGIINGTLTVIIGSATLIALKYAAPELVFPLTVAGPMILVLVLGRLLYREHLNIFSWAACLVGVLGLIGLSLGQSL